MSSSLSGLSPISTYLSIVKNEAAAVGRMVKSDPAIQRTVAKFTSDTVTISSPSDLLLSKNQVALQVVLGAYNMEGKSTETGLLRKLLTQDPSVSGSLVKSLGSTDDLHFVKAMSPRTTVSFGFGVQTASSFVTGGSAASSISFSNLAWETANTSLTATSPAKSWSYVLNDGTALASVAKALTTELQSTGTTAVPVTESYSVDVTTGAIVGSSGAPSITTSTDSAGNTVYGLTLATNSTGAAIRLVSVVAVKSPTSASTTPATASPAVVTPLLTAAMAATGFNVTTDGKGGFSIINPIDNGPLSLSQQSYTAFAGHVAQAISTDQNVLSLGTAGTGMSAGQILTSGGSAIGTVKSVDILGNVTLAAPSAIPLTAGAEIDVAIGAGVNNVGTNLTATTPAAIGDSTLTLGSAAKGLVAGQIISDGNAIIGVVKSVSQSGVVTLQGNLTTAVAAGDSLGILPQIRNVSTAGLGDTTNAKAVLSLYETSQYETQQDKQNPGMGDALYFTRTIPTITTITQLMSDPRLLNVVATNLGLSDTYNQLPYDQQLSLITSKVNLKTLANPSTLQHYAEQFLALSNSSVATGGYDANTSLMLLTGGSSATTSTDGGASLLSALYPNSASTNGLDPLLSILYA